MRRLPTYGSSPSRLFPPQKEGHLNGARAPFPIRRVSFHRRTPPKRRRMHHPPPVILPGVPYRIPSQKEKPRVLYDYPIPNALLSSQKDLRYTVPVRTRYRVSLHRRTYPIYGSPYPVTGVRYTIPRPGWGVPECYPHYASRYLIPTFLSTYTVPQKVRYRTGGALMG